MSRIWATPTWYFFHTFAEKINPYFYRANSWKCFNIIKNICNNLPCPECRYHATQYVSKIQPRDVSTKEDLKFVLFTFHNHVNRRLGKPIFSWDALELYTRANTLKISKLFLYRFNGSYMSKREFGGWWRRKTSSDVENFLRRYWRYFS